MIYVVNLLTCVQFKFTLKKMTHGYNLKLTQVWESINFRALSSLKWTYQES